jgi:hypothetical protein
METKKEKAVPTKNRTQTPPTKTETARAAINSPLLSPDNFKLGDVEFTIKDLSYDDYMEFITMLSPVIDTLFSKVAERSGVNIPGVQINTSSISIKAIFDYCANDLPNMAHIVTRQSRPDLDVEAIKNLGKTPIMLAQVVMAQLKRNNVIAEMADFFRLLQPMMSPTKK